MLMHRQMKSGNVQAARELAADKRAKGLNVVVSDLTKRMPFMNDQAKGRSYCFLGSPFRIKTIAIAPSAIERMIKGSLRVGRAAEAARNKIDAIKIKNPFGIVLRD
jgi:hypothetical protein